MTEVMMNMERMETLTDYEAILAALKDLDFLADMTDDFSVWEREKREVNRARWQAEKLAKERGII